MYNKAEHLQKHMDQKGLITKLRILDLEEVQLVRAVFDNERPILILSFAVQENRELSDKTGEVVEGKNAVQLVHYVWLMTYDDERGWLIADQSIQLSQAIL
jgi:predicted lipid-binding transport protein (Tim44 family)